MRIEELNKLAEHLLRGNILDRVKPLPSKNVPIKRNTDFLRLGAIFRIRARISHEQICTNRNQFDHYILSLIKYNIKFFDTIVDLYDSDIEIITECSSNSYFRKLENSDKYEICFILRKK